MADAKPIPYFVMDGKQAGVGYYNSGRGYSTQRFSPQRLAIFPNSLQAEQGVAGQIWPSPQLRMWYGPSAKVELLSDNKHPGQVGLRVKTYSHPTPKSKQLQETILWLDPARDDVPVEKIRRTYEKDNKTVKREYISRYMGYAQLPSGQWYPTQWQVTSGICQDVSRGQSHNRGFVKGTRQYNLRIFPNVKLGEEWFTDPSEKWKAAVNKE